MRTVAREIVSALIFSKDGKLLMGQKNPAAGGVYADCWHIPGGGIESGETHQAALRREILEETGIDITQAKVTLADNKGTGTAEKTLPETGETVLCSMKFNVYRVDIDDSANSTVIQTNDDLKTLAWVDLKDLKNYLLTPPSIDLFTRLGYIV
jgi:8-oxo-dGTP pyrophosphatase MutT (NUDIX family)